MEAIRDLKSVFAENVRRFREDSGKTKSELCKDIGMSRAFWDKVESGEKEARVSTVERIAEALGVSVLDLFTEPRSKRRELVRSK